MSESKRDQLIAGAFKVFYQNGFHASGMDLIASKVGISKTSIYKHFRTKEELIQATLKLRDEQFRSWLFGYVENNGSTPKEQLLALFDAHTEWFNQKDFLGCMFIKAAAEYQNPEDPLHQASAEHKLLIEQFVLEKVKWMGAKNPKELTAQLIVLIEGSIVVAKIMGSDSVSDHSKNAARILIDESMKVI